MFRGSLIRPTERRGRFVFIFCCCCSVTSNSVQPHGLQCARPPCPPPSPGVCPSSCPLSRWCHPTILSSVIPEFSFYLQSFPTSGSFPMRRLFASGGQNTGASASASVLPMNIQGWFPLGLSGLISLLSKGFIKLPQFSLGFCLRNKSSHRPQRSRLPCPPASPVPGDGLKDFANGPGDSPPVSSSYPGGALVRSQQRRLQG